MTKRKIIDNIQKKKVNNRFLLYEDQFVKRKILEQFKSEDDSEKENNAISKSIRDNLGEEHPFEYSQVRELTKKFGLINAVVDKYTDFTIGPGISIKCDDKQAKAVLDEWIENTKFNLYITPWAKSAFNVGTGWLEIAGLSDSKKDNIIKVVSPDTIFVKKDKYGTVTAINQFLGKDFNRITDNNVKQLNKDEMIPLVVNKLDNSFYGYGLIYSAMSIVDDFLMAQKAQHKLLKRKANSPFHVKLGNAEKDDYPEQADIEAYGEKLKFMNEVTEWVSGPNVEMKILDFGDVGEKFISVLQNDYKLLSYSFQIPEVLLGAGNVAEGLANVQMDSYERRIRSLQRDFGFVIKEKILKRVLNNAGLDVSFDVVWGSPSSEELYKKLTSYSTLLANSGMSPGLKTELEKKLCLLLDINYIDVEQKNIENEEKQMELMNMSMNKENPERKKEENEKLPVVPSSKSREFVNCIKGVYAKEKHTCKHCIEEGLADWHNDFSVEEWTNTNLTDLKVEILNAISKDSFSNLAALDKIEEMAGYYTATQIDEFKGILEEAFSQNKSVKWIEKQMESKGLTKDLYAYDKTGLLEKDGEKILLLDGKYRNNLISRTETVRMASEGALNNYKNSDVQEVRWLAPLSDRTCEECASLNGEIFNITEASGDQPLHPNCRCTWVPVIKGLSD